VLIQKRKGILAEAVSIDKVVQNKDGEYAVIIDRISQDVPFIVTLKCSIDGNKCYKQSFLVECR
jgi:acyl CoA:acetate/3-ketoacid CoA transferase alpha subunit